MLDYVDRVSICWKLEAVLKEQELWPDICAILRKHLMFLFATAALGLRPFFLVVLEFVFFTLDWCFSSPLLPKSYYLKISICGIPTEFLIQA